LWIIGLFAQLPLIPSIETDYISSETNDTLGKGVLVDEKGAKYQVRSSTVFSRERTMF
jgi:hypothetical protein